MRLRQCIRYPEYTNVSIVRRILVFTKRERRMCTRIHEKIQREKEKKKSNLRWQIAWY